MSRVDKAQRVDEWLLGEGRMGVSDRGNRFLERVMRMFWN